jgi:hypothetical protein
MQPTTSTPIDLPVTEEGLPAFSLSFVRAPDGKLGAPGDAIVVRMGTTETNLTPRPLRELFRGSRKAPDLSRGPTPALMPLFLFLEATVVRFCEEDGRDETDEEMERIFSELRRRPDGRHLSPLHAYLHAAARVYLSARDVSEAEYEAVMSRLTKSARTFSIPPISRNYVTTLRRTIGTLGWGASV